MAEITVAHPRTRDTDETRAALRARAARGLELYEARGAAIVRTAPFMYNVPSCSGDDFYVVNYRRESCECEDYRRRGDVCKHIYAAGIHRAKRRGGRR
jgi:hypothetical protein